jgi:hypothetical protein
VGTFDYPAASTIAGDGFAGTSLLATPTDVPSPSERLDKFMDLRVVIAFVQTQIDLAFFWLRSLELVQSWLQQFHVVAVGPVDNER